ncbi:MAG TPA: hypothetical protein PLR07_12055, partial [Promineifilum sp.]|nr:hypothetical protein [Promineifilum sp.]
GGEGDAAAVGAGVGGEPPQGVDRGGGGCHGEIIELRITNYELRIRNGEESTKFTKFTNFEGEPRILPGCPQPRLRRFEGWRWWH